MLYGLIPFARRRCGEDQSLAVDAGRGGDPSLSGVVLHGRFLIYETNSHYVGIFAEPAIGEVYVQYRPLPQQSMWCNLSSAVDTWVRDPVIS